MVPHYAKDILLYYAGGILLALLIILRRRPRKGIRLRLRGSKRENQVAAAEETTEPQRLDGRRTEFSQFSHIRPPGERPLNVIFNYNGHSWDAYEVLGLPAGSSPERVDEAYAQALKRMNSESHSFLAAALAAIHSEWSTYRKAR